MATYSRRLTVQDGAQHIRAYCRAFEVLYGPYDAFLRGGEVYETDYHNRHAHLIRLSDGHILNGQVKIVSLYQANHRSLRVEVASIDRTGLRYTTLKILAPLAVSGTYVNLPELFIISKE